MEHINHLWKSPADHLTLPPGTVHIWQVALDQPATSIAQLAQTLASDERVRAAQFHFERDRRRFVVARGILRSLLASYTHRPAEHLRFTYSKSGKPTLAEQSEGDGLHLYFNLAHSAEIALYAFTLEHEVGIDVEHMYPLADVQHIAGHYFSPRERALLAPLSGDELYRTFFTYWTRKEAYLKACGEGLALLSWQLDVVAPLGQVVKLSGSHSEADWYVHDLIVAADYCGALALHELNTHIVYCG